MNACVFSIDDSYVMPFKVFFHSLHKTKSILPGLPIFILHTHSLAPESISSLKLFLSSYECKATFLDASLQIPSDLPISGHVSAATFFRLFVTDIFPDEIDQIVYLDCDMLCLNNISMLFAHKTTSLIAAVDHCSPLYGINLFGEAGSSYFQAGVLIIPLKKWRQLDMISKFRKILEARRKDLRHWDQDVLNLAFRDSWERLPLHFNVCREVYSCILNSDSSSKRVLLVHFDGPSKPWVSTYRWEILNSSIHLVRWHTLLFRQLWESHYHEVFGQSFRSNFEITMRSRHVIRYIRNKIARSMSRFLQR